MTREQLLQRAAEERARGHASNRRLQRNDGHRDSMDRLSEAEHFAAAKAFEEAAR